MGVEFDIAEFIKEVKRDGPPFKCPLQNCDKIYRSALGIRHHLQTFDHDTMTTILPSTPGGTPGRGRGRGRGRVGNTPKIPATPAETAREPVTYDAADKTVTFDVNGNSLTVGIDEELEVLDVEEYDALVEAGQCLPYEEVPPEPHIKLPEAAVKEVKDYSIADAPPRPNAYIRFIEKTAEELDGEVEYDVDEEDTTWLEVINEKRAAEGSAPISVESLELLLDRLEKESYFQAASNGQSGGAIVDDDAVCCICMDGECQNTNVILFCDMCNLAVHQDCYGVPYIPEGQWLCRRCLQSPSRPVDCVLCPNKGGAFKQTDRGNQWAHVVCALWIPEVRFANTVFLEPIDSIEEIPAARWRLCCYICKQKGVGACIQCHRGNCYAAFHVTCAQQAGLHMRMDTVRDEGAGADQPVIVQKLAFCDAHTPAHADSNDDGGSDSEAERAREESRQKMKQARKMLAKKRTSAPVILIPTIPPDRVFEIANLISATKKQPFIQRLIAYWTLKRYHRNGVPLLRRLQSATHASSAGTRSNLEGSPDAKELYQQLKYWQSLRRDLEKARLLCELVRKREKLKLSYLKAHEQHVMMEINPVLVAMHNLLDMLVQKDTGEIFREPVNQEEVPDYGDIVKYPMDLGTMRTKVETGMYGLLDDFESDFDLMIRNCLAYNDRDTIFYRAGVRMRDQCAPHFKQVRQELEAKGLVAAKKDDEMVGQEIDEEMKRLLQEPASQSVLTGLQMLYERAVARHGICKTKRVRVLKAEMAKVTGILEKLSKEEKERRDVAEVPEKIKVEKKIKEELDEGPIHITPTSSPIKGANSAPNNASPSGVNRRTAVLFTRKAQQALKKPEVVTQLEFNADESMAMAMELDEEGVDDDTPKVKKTGRRPGRPPKKGQHPQTPTTSGVKVDNNSTPSGSTSSKKSPMKDFLNGSMPLSFRVYRSDKKDVPGSDESDLSNGESGSCSSCSGSDSSDFE